MPPTCGRCLVAQKASPRSKALHLALGFGQSQQLIFNLQAQMKKHLAELIAFEAVFLPTKLPQPVGRLRKKHRLRLCDATGLLFTEMHNKKKKKIIFQ